MENAEITPSAEVAETEAGTGEVQDDLQEELKNLELLLDIPLDLSVEVGRTKILVRELLKMDEGYVVELAKASNEPLDVYVNSRLIARGEVVLVDEKLGLRLTDVVSPAERIENLA